MVAGFATMGITATGISLTVPTYKVVAAQPYVASSYPSYASPAFDVSFHFAGTAAAPSLNSQTSTYLHNAVVAAFTTAGIPNAGVNMRSDMGNGSHWGANCTISVAESAANQTAAILQYLQTTQVGGADASANTFGALITADLVKQVPSYANTITVNDFEINTSPTGASATGVLVNFTGIFYTGTRLFDAEDDAEEHEPAAAAASWTLPILGVFGLFSLVTLIGMGVRRRQPKSTRQINYSEISDVETQPLTVEALE
jgi:hypothetical protein